ncbi:unnamed protein product, partial [Pylaiella littoralis]
MQVGVGVNSDFGVKAKAGMDLAVASRRYLSRSLLGTRFLLCSELLQRDLPKSQSLRMSAWEGELSARQDAAGGQRPRSRNVRPPLHQ